MPVRHDRIQEPNAREVLRLSELYLDNILQISLAADARAMQISVASSPIAVALFIFACERLSSADSCIDRVLSNAAFAASACFFTALILALFAAGPRPLDVSGNIRSNWEDRELIAPLAISLLQQAEFYDKMALDNLEMLQKRAHKVRLALRTLAVAPVASAVVAGITAFCGAYS